MLQVHYQRNLCIRKSFCVYIMRLIVCVINTNFGEFLWSHSIVLYWKFMVTLLDSQSILVLHIERIIHICALYQSTLNTCLACHLRQIASGVDYRHTRPRQPLETSVRTTRFIAVPAIKTIDYICHDTTILKYHKHWNCHNKTTSITKSEQAWNKKSFAIQIIVTVYSAYKNNRK